jgi:hypothetical protein
MQNFPDVSNMHVWVQRSRCGLTWLDDALGRRTRHAGVAGLLFYVSLCIDVIFSEQRHGVWREGGEEKEATTQAARLGSCARGVAGWAGAFDGRDGVGTQHSDQEKLKVGHGARRGLAWVRAAQR